MNSEVKKSLNQILEKNESITDLSEFKIDESTLVHIHEQIAINKNIFFLKWNENISDLSPNNLKLMKKIEDCLASNNQNHDKFPDDSTFCVLTKVLI